ncbi:MAG: MarR family transcriptional regulator [Zetaproteobacteria bacterium CG2_30_46_52]|nr:MAG: MarR family transcriptional regulator [Zetaproteobacteria bacterium CG2_30_46_52]
MVQKTQDFELERAIGFYVNRAAYLMSEGVAKRFSEAGFLLTAQDFGILFRLHKEDGLTQMQLASLMMRDKTTITRRLDGLVKKRLIERRTDAADRRHFRIHLSEEGKAAMPILMAVVANFQIEALTDVSDEEKQITINTLQKITAQLTKG